MSGTFTGRLQLDFGDFTAGNADWTGSANAGRYAITLAPISWSSEAVFAVIPAGYMSDGASVPRLLWWFLPPWGDRATVAALLHDYLLDRLLGFVPGGPVAGAASRVACDRQFLLALLALGVPRWRATVAWLGVRAHSIRIDLTGSTDRPLAG